MTVRSLLPVLLTLSLGLGAMTAARADDPGCDPLAIDLTLSPQRTLIYPSLKETVKVQAAVPAAADAVLVGDSLLAGWRTDLPVTFPATAIYDFAVGGDRVPNVLWRLQNTRLSGLSPAAVALLIGTNDLAAGTPACAVGIGITKIVEQLRAAWPAAAIFVLTIPPRGRDFHDLDDRRLVVNQHIAGLGRRFDKVYPVVIDDTALTCGLYGRPPSAPAPAATTPAGRSVCAAYADDNLHFSTAGYVELGRMVQAASLAAVGENLFK